MKEFFCWDCDHVWHDLDHAGCPVCKSKNIMDSGEDDVTGWNEDGHFEGTFDNLYHMDDTGE